MNLPSLLSGDDASFDGYDEFVPEHLPEPGDHFAGHDVLTGREHAAVHRLARDLFDERGVYDVTFGFDLARLNLDHRHADAGFRYARAADDPRVLLAVFTPTTEFCPQSQSLTVGAFRAWNGSSGRHEYDLVRVQVAPMHQRSGRIDRRLRHLASRYEETGSMPDSDAATLDVGVPGRADAETF